MPHTLPALPRSTKPVTLNRYEKGQATRRLENIASFLKSAQSAGFSRTCNSPPGTAHPALEKEPPRMKKTANALASSGEESRRLSQKSPRAWLYAPDLCFLFPIYRSPGPQSNAPKKAPRRPRSEDCLQCSTPPPSPCTRTKWGPQVNVSQQATFFSVQCRTISRVGRSSPTHPARRRMHPHEKRLPSTA